jgi:hypothetical protein
MKKRREKNGDAMMTESADNERDKDRCACPDAAPRATPVKNKQHFALCRCTVYL